MKGRETDSYYAILFQLLQLVIGLFKNLEPAQLINLWKQKKQNQFAIWAASTKQGSVLGHCFNYQMNTEATLTMYTNANIMP